MPEFIDVELQSESSSDSEWLHLSAYWVVITIWVLVLIQLP